MIFPASIVANCPGSGGTGAGLLGSHCARPSGDIGARNMCLDASTIDTIPYERDWKPGVISTFSCALLVAAEVR